MSSAPINSQTGEPIPGPGWVVNERFQFTERCRSLLLPPGPQPAQSGVLLKMRSSVLPKYLHKCGGEPRAAAESIAAHKPVVQRGGKERIEDHCVHLNRYHVLVKDGFQSNHRCYRRTIFIDRRKQISGPHQISHGWITIFSSYIEDNHPAFRSVHIEQVMAEMVTDFAYVLMPSKKPPESVPGAATELQNVGCNNETCTECKTLQEFFLSDQRSFEYSRVTANYRKEPQNKNTQSNEARRPKQTRSLGREESDRQHVVAVTGTTRIAETYPRRRI
ncbi:hypothetical protein C8R43DRAFT_959005 [Mycena crocata]|nr:hypothetical protein C8R43DRAFT_959005 [Mycena crocata]